MGAARKLEHPDLPLYVDDAELARRLGVSDKELRTALSLWEKLKPPFPKSQPLLGNKRLWPACRQWLLRQGGVDDMLGGSETDTRGKWS